MNKREQQRIIKEEKQRAAHQREKISATVRKTVFFVVIPLLVVFTAYVLLNQGTTYSTTEIAENDHVREPGAKPVSIVVYADFQCPACATENQTILQAWPSIRDSAQLVFRHFHLESTDSGSQLQRADRLQKSPNNSCSHKRRRNERENPLIQKPRHRCDVVPCSFVQSTQKSTKLT